MQVLATPAAAEEEESEATHTTCLAQGKTKESTAVTDFFIIVKMLSNSYMLRRMTSLPKWWYLFLPWYIQTSEKCQVYLSQKLNLLYSNTASAKQAFFMLQQVIKLQREQGNATLPRAPIDCWNWFTGVC